MRVGVITNNQKGIFQSLIISGLREAIEPQGYEVVVDSLDQNPHHNAILDPAQLKGILVIANPVPDDFVRYIYQAGIPISLVSHLIPDTPIPTLMFNHAQGIAVLVKHLVEQCGRRKLLFIRGIPKQIDAMQREAAFHREMMRYNLTDSQFIQGDFAPEVAIQSLEKLLAQGLSFDGVLAADYVMAGAVRASLQGHGIKVPEQVAVVGFGDAPEAESGGITTVAADVQELGRRAANQLISQMSGLKMRGTTTLSVELVVRQSSGCKPNG